MNGAITGAYTYLFNHAVHFGNSTGETVGSSENASSEEGLYGPSIDTDGSDESGPFKMGVNTHSSFPGVTVRRG